MWPASAPATAREGACAPQASECVGLGEDLGRARRSAAFTPPHLLRGCVNPKGRARESRPPRRGARTRDCRWWECCGGCWHGPNVLLRRRYEGFRAFCRRKVRVEGRRPLGDNSCRVQTSSTWRTGRKHEKGGNSGPQGFLKAENGIPRAVSATGAFMAPIKMQSRRR